MAPRNVIDWTATTMSRLMSPANENVAGFGVNLDVSEPPNINCPYWPFFSPVVRSARGSILQFIVNELYFAPAV